jgi:phosphotransferase system IIB component
MNMNQLNTNKLAAGIIAAVMIALLLTTVVVYRDNTHLKEVANKEKLQAEKLLSEKLMLTKEINEFKGEIASLKGKNKEADLLLEKAGRKLNEQEVAINSLSKEAADAKQLRKQLTDVKKIRENLLGELQKIMASQEELNQFNAVLKNKNEELTKDVNNLNGRKQVACRSVTGKVFYWH